MAYRNYKPKVARISAASLPGGIVYTEKLSGLKWTLVLIKGTAVGFNGSILGSGAIQVWESANPTTGPAQHVTFTDSEGKYGVTCKSGVGLLVKFYSK